LHASEEVWCYGPRNNYIPVKGRGGCVLELDKAIIYVRGVMECDGFGIGVVLFSVKEERRRVWE